MASIPECLAQLKAVGFEIVEYGDMADPTDPLACADATLPWYFPLDGFYDRSFLNMYYMWAMKPFGRAFTKGLVGILEMFRIAPAGSKQTASVLVRIKLCGSSSRIWALTSW